MIAAVFGLLGNPLFRSLLIGMALIAAVMYIRYDARMQERARCNAANLQAEIVEMQRRVAAAEKVAAEYQKTSRNHKQELTVLQGKLEEYEKILSERSDSERCSLSDDDVKRLLNIR